MVDFLKKVTWVHSVALMVGALLAVAVAWNTLGWDTIAMASEVQVVAQQSDNYYMEQKSANDETRLMILYDRLAAHRNNVATEKRILAADPFDMVAPERINNITTDMERIQRQINRIESRDN